VTSNDATISPEMPTLENHKKDEKLYLLSLESAPACTAEGIETKDQIQIVTVNGRSNDPFVPLQELSNDILPSHLYVPIYSSTCLRDVKYLKLTLLEIFKVYITSCYFCCVMCIL
jgi:hypothetical protein